MSHCICRAILEKKGRDHFLKKGNYFVKKGIILYGRDSMFPTYLFSLDEFEVSDNDFFQKMV
jgi:hypothetical protein